MDEHYIPKVSIIIPVYNGSKYLNYAIESALDQTYNNTEIIVINDGSTDNGLTDEIAKGYGDQIRYFHKDNGGTSSSLNFGIKKMCGDYFSWLSHDDIYLPHKIEKQISYLTNNNLKICYSKVILIDDKGSIIRKDHSQWYPRTEAIKKILPANYINGCSILINIECFKKVGIFNEKLKYTQDTEMWIRLLSRYDLGLIDDFLVQYRYYDDSRTRRKRLSIVNEEKKMIKDVFDLIVIDTLHSQSKTNIEYHIFQAKLYNWLGDLMSSKRYWFDFADQFYIKSTLIWKSFFNPAFVKSILGSRLVSIPSRLKRRIFSFYRHIKI